MFAGLQVGFKLFVAKHCRAEKGTRFASRECDVIDSSHDGRDNPRYR